MSDSKIALVPGAKVNFREGSARALWYEHLKAHKGKTVKQFCDAAEKNPPSLQPKGKYGAQNKVEPPSGWLKFFINNGYAELK